MKHCGRCDQDLPFDAFGKKGTGLQAWCRACSIEYQREWYDRNREKHIAVVGERRKLLNAKIREHVKEAKSVPCVDCKKSYPPYVMDFDHMGLEEKHFIISDGARHGSMKKLIAEIAKCEVVCANCHRERSHARLTPL